MRQAGNVLAIDETIARIVLNPRALVLLISHNHIAVECEALVVVQVVHGSDIVHLNGFIVIAERHAAAHTVEFGEGIDHATVGDGKRLGILGPGVKIGAVDVVDGRAGGGTREGHLLAIDIHGIQNIGLKLGCCHLFGRWLGVDIDDNRVATHLIVAGRQRHYRRVAQPDAGRSTLLIGVFTILTFIKREARGTVLVAKAAARHLNLGDVALSRREDHVFILVNA